MRPGAISRRQFVAGVASAGLLAGCGRLPWQAQPAPKVARIGVLSQSADPSNLDNAAFRQGLRDLGYSEGQNITLVWRSAESRIDQFPELAADLVNLSVDVIVAQGSAATQAAKQASVTIPVVMAFTSDPVRAGLVATLAHPGGNVTGLSTMVGPLGPKRLELLRDTVPGLMRVAMLWNPGDTERANELEELAGAAQALGLGGLQSVALRHGDDLESAFANILQGRAEALLLQGGSVMNRYRAEIVDFSIAHRLPMMSGRRDFVAAGGLMSYGPDFPGTNRRAAYYVDRILKGANPADLPIEQPMLFDFVVNLKTARALGITFPNEIMLQVTEVIQ